MTKQRRQGRRTAIGSMSFIERAGLLFGVVGLLADAAVLFTFATGVSNLHDYIPASVSSPSGELFFALTSGLILIYGWFALSWYLVRRTFVLLGQMPIRFDRPVVRRATQTVIGVGVGIIPLAIAWSLVNLPDAMIKRAAFSSYDSVQVTVTPAPSATYDPAATPNVNATQTPVYITFQARPKSEQALVSSGWFAYFAICFLFFALLFGFIVWLPINLLMPIVHVELLLGDAAPDVLDALREFFEE